MADSLATLVRLHAWNVDQRRRALGLALATHGQLVAKLDALEQEVLAEQATAAGAPTEAGLTYGGYARAVIQRRERLRQAIAEAEAEIERANEALRAAYLEHKTYEIGQRNRARAAAQEADRRETNELSEIALQGRRRNLSQPGVDARGQPPRLRPARSA